MPRASRPKDLLEFRDEHVTMAQPRRVRREAGVVRPLVAAERRAQVEPEVARERPDHDVLSVGTLEGLVRDDLRVPSPEARDDRPKPGDRRDVVAEEVQRGLEHRDLDVLALGVSVARIQGGQDAGQREQP